MKRYVHLWLSLLVFVAFVAAVAAYRSSAPGLRLEHAEIPPERILSGNDDGSRLALELLPDERINVNTATAEELRRLPGIGEVLSEAIVSYREEHGPFSSAEELLAVKGIGSARLAAILEHICFDG